MASNRLTTLFVILVAIVGYLVHYKEREDLAWLLIPLFILLAVIWALRPQIDYWWGQHFPPDLDPMGRKIVEQYPFYQRLTSTEKDIFRSRVNIFAHNKVFSAIGTDTVPDDIKIMVAANAIILTMDQDNYLMDHFEHIVFYPNPFPSPQYTHAFHNSELETDDGTLIFSLPSLLKSQRDYPRSINLALYEWAKALLFSNPDYPVPYYTWEELETKTSYSKKVIEQEIGLPIDDIRPIVLHHQIWFSEKFTLDLS